MTDAYTQSQQSRSNLPITIWGATDVGHEREGNEDSVYPHSGSTGGYFQPKPALLAQKGHLFIVADGVGGAQGGSEASQWAIRVAVERYYDMPGPDLAADLKAAVEAANTSLHHYLQEVGKTEAGCTMVAAVIQNGTLHVANVGDSRAYRIRNGKITQVTIDHTLTQHKLDQGQISAQQAALDPDSSVLTRSMGTKPSVKADVFSPLRLADGETVLLCSDGLTDMLPDQEIAGMAVKGAPNQATGRLIKAANQRGGFDNISVVVAQVGEKKAMGAADLVAGLGRMVEQRKTLWMGLGAALLIALMAMVGWMMYGSNNSPEPTLVAPIVTEPSVTEPSATPTVPFSPLPTDTVPPGAPTSTLRPTATDTPTLQPPTRIPPTSEPTAVPIFISPTIDPGSSDPGSGSEPGPEPEPEPEPEPGDDPDPPGENEPAPPP